MPYHVRVLIPCYREPLQIVVKTINAAYDAVLPAGCHRTIYVCDDGKDPKLRRFCRAMGPSVVYVSGRRRAAGEMNGKSGNLNNCMTQIYPEGEPVPYNELICVFDADQVLPYLLQPCGCRMSIPFPPRARSAAVQMSSCWPAGHQMAVDCSLSEIALAPVLKHGACPCLQNSQPGAGRQQWVTGPSSATTAQRRASPERSRQSSW